MSILLSLLCNSAVAEQDICNPPGLLSVFREYGTEITEYNLAGYSLAEIAEERKLKAPRDQAGLWRDAYFSWGLDWRWRVDKASLASNILPGTIKLGEKITLTIPCWQNRHNGSLAEQQEWDRFFTAIIAHEKIHLEYYLLRRSKVKFILDPIHSGRKRGTPDTTNRSIKGMLSKINARDHKFDELTDHGRVEGVLLTPQ